ncbi:MAG: hypothetical protein JWR61_4711 [Ferruginibacter sp.]|nr:hypothetical protein [Ferruginibacter sp.]
MRIIITPQINLINTSGNKTFTGTWTLTSPTVGGLNFFLLSFLVSGTKKVKMKQQLNKIPSIC